MVWVVEHGYIFRVNLPNVVCKILPLKDERGEFRFSVNPFDSCLMNRESHSNSTNVSWARSGIFYVPLTRWTSKTRVPKERWLHSIGVRLDQHDPSFKRRICRKSIKQAKWQNKMTVGFANLSCTWNLSLAEFNWQKWYSLYFTNIL